MMKLRFLTAILLMICGLGVGWLAYWNLMWAVWGKQNAWFEYVGFWGCPLMIVAGLIVFKSLRVGSILGLVGFLLMLFYLGPVVVNTVHAIVVGRLTLNPPQMVELILIIIFPLLTLGTLSLNIVRVSGQAR